MTDRTEFAIRKRDVLLDVRERTGGIWSVEVKIDESCAPDEALEDLADLCRRARRAVLKALRGEVAGG